MDKKDNDIDKFDIDKFVDLDDFEDSDELIKPKSEALLKDKDLKDSDLEIDKISESENLEDHYSKMYKDLPPDIVKMLINTHPLYGDKKSDKKVKRVVTEADDFEEDTLSVDLKEAQDKEVKVLKENLNLEEEPEIIPEKKPIPKNPKKKARPVHNNDNEEDEEEKEFLYSLFSKEEEKEALDKQDSGPGKYIAIGILTIALIVCIIGMIVSFIQNNKNKELVDKLTKERDSLSLELKNEKNLQESNFKEKEELAKEIESLKNQLNLASQPNQEPEQPEENSNSENPNNTETNSNGQKTYTVQAKDNFWKISLKVYGDGKYFKNIIEANNLSENYPLKTGEILIIPDISN